MEDNLASISHLYPGEATVFENNTVRLSTR